MEKVSRCQQCGSDGGLEKNFIHCSYCKKFSVHHYCIDEHSITKKDWVCDHCLHVQKSNLSFNGFNKAHEPIVYAEPLIRSIWNGTFNLYFGSKTKIMDGLSAYLSSKACQRVYDETMKFNSVVQFNMVQKSLAWPKGFGEGGPSDDHIGIYFFRSLKLQPEYDYLVFEMMRDDLVMRSCDLKDTELLVFTSVDLPPKVRRFQGMIYLWGVLRPKSVV